MSKMNILKIILSLIKSIFNKFCNFIFGKAYNEGWLRNQLQQENDKIFLLYDNFCLQKWDSSLRTQKYEILISLKYSIEKFGNLKKKEHKEIYEKTQDALNSINKNKDVKDIVEIKNLIVCYLNKFRG